MVSNSEDVIVVGGGPTGLFLAGELARAGVGCRVLERRASRTEESRALGLHARSLEVLDLRGVVDEFLARGNPISRVRLSLGQALVDFGRLDTRFGHMQILPQSTTEEILERRARDLGATLERGVRVVGVHPEGDEVIVESVDSDGNPREDRARWVVGCDGSNSAVRESQGIPFTGKTYPYTIMVADVRLADAPSDPLMIHVGGHGLVVSTDFGNGWFRLGVIDRTKEWSDDPVTMDEVRTTLASLFGRDLGPSDPLWTSRFRIQERQAETYRTGRVLLAGDAAHVHSPLGGQGLNLGLQDAMNLGWKLAAVVAGKAPETLLDTYPNERRRISQQVIKATDIATRMMTSPLPPARILRRAMVPRVLGRDRGHDLAAGHLSGIYASYPRRRRPGGDRLVGRRLPDFPVDGERGRTSLFPLLREGGFVFVDQTGGELAPECEPWEDRVSVVTGRVERPAALAATDGVLSRPDGYCAWAGSRDDVAGLRAALRSWCGIETPTGADRRASAPHEGVDEVGDEAGHLRG